VRILVVASAHSYIRESRKLNLFVTCH
jgi:hypothetical protein